jgi:raffinose/stachyose/melibiose transport system substrate-binding protein
MKKLLSVLAAVLVVFSFASCAKKAVSKSDAVPTIDKIKLGEDYKDLKASVKFLTHRTDLVDTKLKEYVAEFKKMYPNIDIVYEGVTDYAQDVTIRLTTDNWGDICMIPTTIDKSELPRLFVPYGDKATLDTTYNFLNNFYFNNVVYGMPSTGNAQGIVYNKKVFAAAGITAIPKTPEEFLADLKLIKEKTKAIPLYTNFAAQWTMGAWDAYIGGSATGDADFMNVKLPHMKAPFADKGDGTGPYAVYNVLYEAVARKLIENDPTTTDWEGCKGMINRGEIATMVLGSWSVVQMQAAGPNAADIGYMPFPITIGGKQFAAAGPDYTYGINAKSPKENQIAAMLYVKWLVEQSKFAYSEGGIPIVKTEAYPDVYKDFADITLVVDNVAPSGEETFLNDLNTKSEVGINKENTHVQNVLEAAWKHAKTMKQIADDWDNRWAKAQTELKIEVKY